MVVLLKIFLLTSIAAGVWNYLTGNGNGNDMEDALLSVLVAFCTFVLQVLVFLFFYFMIWVW